MFPAGCLSFRNFPHFTAVHIQRITTKLFTRAQASPKVVDLNLNFKCRGVFLHRKLR